MTGRILSGYRHEEWRTVPGFPHYAVSSLGRVKAYDRTRADGRRYRERVLSTPSARMGYPSVSLWRDGEPHPFCVHRLVALAFLGEPPPGALVLHKDGDRKNNDVANLRYGTHAENAADARAHGTWTRGSKARSTKLTEDAAAQLRALRGIVSTPWLARVTGLRQSTVWALFAGRNWSYVAPRTGPLTTALISAHPDEEEARAAFAKEFAR